MPLKSIAGMLQFVRQCKIDRAWMQFSRFLIDYKQRTVFFKIDIYKPFHTTIFSHFPHVSGDDVVLA